jgi:hypothetical protein
MLVKLMLVPLVDATAVPEVIMLAPITGVPLIVGLVKVGEVKVGDVKDTPDTILEDETDAGLFGIAFNTELT